MTDLAVILIVYAVVLKAVYMGLPELFREEAYYWKYAQHLDFGYLDHPPLVAWVIWIATKVLGHTELAVRLGAFVSWLVGFYFVYGLSRTIYDTDTAKVALLFFVMLPVYFGFGFLMVPDAPLIACWAAVLFYSQRAIVHQRPRAWWGVGFFVGLGLLAKYTMLLLGGSVLIFIVFNRETRHCLRSAHLYFGIVMAFLLFLPVIYWNSQNEWVSFAFQSVRRILGEFNYTG